MPITFQDGRFAEYVRQLAGDKGGAPTFTALPDVFPVAVVSGDRPEDAYLRGEKTYAAGRRVAAGGAVSQVHLESPGAADGGATLIVLEGLQVEAASGFWLALTAAATIGVTSIAMARDTRSRPINGAFPKANIVTASAVAVAAALVEALRFPATMPAPNLPPIILAPGSRLVIESQVAAENLAVNLYWREVPVPRF